LPGQSAAKAGRTPISSNRCFTESSRREWSGIDGQLIRARKRELTSQTSTQKNLKKVLPRQRQLIKEVAKTSHEEAQKKFKKSLAMLETTDKTVPPEELAQ
jgi:uncharacterized protein with WD repeat